MSKTNLATITDPRAELDYFFDPEFVRRQRWQEVKWVATKKGNTRADIDGLRYVVFRRGARFGLGVAAPGRKIDWRPQLYRTMVDAKAAACLDFCLREEPEQNAKQAVEASTQAQAPARRYARWRLAPDPVLDLTGKSYWLSDLGGIRYAVSKTGTGEFVWRAYDRLGDRHDVLLWPDTYATADEAKAAVTDAYGIDLSEFH
jgi:hypothetical protein